MPTTPFYFFCVFSPISIRIVKIYKPDHISLIGGNYHASYI
nr:MAG TPA: hypothetical protein [Bacteriophage sp.]